jgi:hypothetical protein
MEKLIFTITIKASRAKVWDIMLSDETETPAEFKNMFESSWPKSLKTIKELAEQ